MAIPLEFLIFALCTITYLEYVGINVYVRTKMTNVLIQYSGFLILSSAGTVALDPYLIEGMPVPYAIFPYIAFSGFILMFLGSLQKMKEWKNLVNFRGEAWTKKYVKSLKELPLKDKLLGNYPRLDRSGRL